MPEPDCDPSTSPRLRNNAAATAFNPSNASDASCPACLSVGCGLFKLAQRLRHLETRKAQGSTQVGRYQRILTCRVLKTLDYLIYTLPNSGLFAAYGVSTGLSALHPIGKFGLPASKVSCLRQCHVHLLQDFVFPIAAHLFELFPQILRDGLELLRRLFTALLRLLRLTLLRLLRPLLHVLRGVAGLLFGSLYALRLFAGFLHRALELIELFLELFRVRR